MGKLIIPENYRSCLSSYETQEAIGMIKILMQKKLCMALKLKRVTAPLFVDPASGLNDDLNGVERPVSFDIPDAHMEAQVVHSLAKWKRMALYNYDFPVGKGLLCDMNAIRRDEELDNLHSAYVDQCDWEKVITEEDRNFDYLKTTVKRIVESICNTLDEVKYQYEHLHTELCREVSFITSQELEDMYPDLTPKERENAYAREKKPIETTGELNDIIRAAIPAKVRAKGGHPSKKTYQAIRIELNHELDVLKNTLDQMIDLLNDHGRICVITFHSLEDRIVKNIFNTNERPCTCPPSFPVCVCGKKSKGRVITRKPILPSDSRSKSAKLRVFERIRE